MPKSDVLLARLVVLLLAAAGQAVLYSPASGQLERVAGASTSPQVWTGRVALPDGSPAAGAVVVTSAGGQAVSAADGRFELALDVPLEAQSVDVTAVADARMGQGSLVANARIVPTSRSATASVGTLVLVPTAECQPRWRATFGGRSGVGGEVRALTVLDEGSGPALYAGGSFTTAGGEAANRIAKWNGSRWSALGSGMGGPVADVHALTVFDDGSGPALHAGGAFTSAGGVVANRVAKWDGSSWTALGSGLNDAVRAFTVFDDGGGPALYVGGLFTTAGGVPADRIAKWDGSSWAALGSGLNNWVHALTVFDDGSGAALYAGGDFTTAGGVAANRIAKWDGSSWSALGSGFSNTILALTTFDDGGGPALYAGGEFHPHRIAKWDGSSWTTFGSVFAGQVRTLGVFDEGSGPALYAGGSFTTAGGVAANRIARWDGSSWAALGSGTSGSVDALAVFDDGSGPALYAGGPFGGAGGITANCIAKWDGSSWSALGRSGLNGWVNALTLFDDASGPALYAGGSFTNSGGVVANRIARWDGSSWAALGSGVTGGIGPTTTVDALAVFDDGSGSALYAGGNFTSAGGIAASHIARWDGSSWSALGSGVGSQVRALTVFDDGSGPALYAGGSFTNAGGVAARRIARWDGSSWAALGVGMAGSSVPDVYSLTCFDDGGGPALYAGGSFTTAGGVAANYIAKWDGSSWSALGGGMGGASYPNVYSLTCFDDGSGPALYAGGPFTTAGGGAANYIAKWDGSSWAALGSGMGGSLPHPHALAVFDDGSGPALHAGGSFVASPAGDSYLAKWGCARRVRPMQR